MKTRTLFCLTMVVSGVAVCLGSRALADGGSSRLSEFTAANVAHNPFWPIGWTGPTEAPRAVPVMHDAEIRPEDFTVSSISIGSQVSAAVINGKIYDEGDYVPLESGSQKIYVQVVSITDQGVILQYHSHRITVKMGEKLAPPKP